MILSGLEIKRLLGTMIHIEPFSEEQLNPNSYNLTLHNELLVYQEHILNVKKRNPNHIILIPEQGFIMWPGKLYLGLTVEHTRTHHYVPMVEGRSSLGRLGLFVNIGAAFGDVGFQGHWTLEMFCVQPIKIYPGMQVCQIYYHSIQGKYVPYAGKYANNGRILPSLMYKDFHKNE